MSLKCCNKNFRGRVFLAMEDTETHIKRLLEYGYCPVCGAKIACLHQRKNNGEKDDFSPKKKKVDDFIRECEQQKHKNYFIVKSGSKQNVTWYYNRFGLKKDFNDFTVEKIKSELITIPT